MNGNFTYCALSGQELECNDDGGDKVNIIDEIQDDDHHDDHDDGTTSVNRYQDDEMSQGDMDEDYNQATLDEGADEETQDKEAY